MAYKIKPMEFIETPTFTRLVETLLDDDEYRELQNLLVDDPERYPKSRKDTLTDKETAVLRDLVKEL